MVDSIRAGPLLTATGDVEVVNRQVFEYFGQTLEELRQWGDEHTVHPEICLHVIEVFTRSITSGQYHRNGAALPAVGWRLSAGSPTAASCSRYNGHIVRGACCSPTSTSEAAQDALRESEHEFV